MATYAENLATARDNLAEELANETARRLALTAAGDPPPTTYTFGGKTFDWNGYLAAVIAQIKALDDAATAADPFEYHQTAYPG